MGRKPKMKKVYIECMDQHVYVREFLVGERNKIRELGEVDYQSLMLILSVCDEDGVGLFTFDDLDAVGNLPQSLSDELLHAVVNLNEPDQVVTAKN